MPSILPTFYLILTTFLQDRYYYSHFVHGEIKVRKFRLFPQSHQLRNGKGAI